MKLSDIIKLENILENLKSEAKIEITKMFEDFNFSFTRKEKFLLMIPGIDIFIIKRVAKRFYNNFKQEDISKIKEEYSYLLGVGNNVANVVSSFVFLSVLTFCVNSIGNINFEVIMCSLITLLGISTTYLHVLFSSNKPMKEKLTKDFLYKNILEKEYIKNMNNIIKNKDFDELKKYIDKESLKNLLVENDFNISYKSLKVFIDGERNKIKKNDKYLKAEEILLSKETVLL